MNGKELYFNTCNMKNILLFILSARLKEMESFYERDNERS